jgi:uncharacterized membrane protein YbhN (UPF0104 family)
MILKMTKNILKTALKLILTGLALFLVFRKIDTTQLWFLTQSIHWIWLFPAVLMFVLSKVLTALRLNLFFRNIGLSISEKLNFELYLVGMFYNLFLPGGIGGDGYKVYLLHKHYKTSVKSLLQSALLDRLGGLVAIVFLLLVLVLAVEMEIPYKLDFDWKWLVWIGLILTFPVLWILQKIFFPSFLRSFWPANGYSILGQLAQLASAWFILISLGITEQILAYQLVFLLSSIVAVLPLTIGGVGARELVFVYSHTLVGIDEAAAVAFSLIFFLISALVSLVGSLIKVKLD